MGFNFVIGFSKDVYTAKERALYFYNQVEGRKTVVAVESQISANELGEPAWFTTLWYNLADPIPEETKEEKFEFIGSTTIDPNDPDWRKKWLASQAEAVQASLDETQAWEDTTVR